MLNSLYYYVIIRELNLSGFLRNPKKEIFKKRGESVMQKDIQPNYKEVEVRCACGNTFMAGSTSDEIRVEICSECHPFYTGKQKNIEKGGRIDKFKKRFNME